MQQQSLIRRATTRQLHRAQESAPFRSAPEIFPTPPPPPSRCAAPLPCRMRSPSFLLRSGARRSHKSAQVSILAKRGPSSGDRCLLSSAIQHGWSLSPRLCPAWCVRVSSNDRSCAEILAHPSSSPSACAMAKSAMSEGICKFVCTFTYLQTSTLTCTIRGGCRVPLRHLAIIGGSLHRAKSLIMERSDPSEPLTVFYGHNTASIHRHFPHCRAALQQVFRSDTMQSAQTVSAVHDVSFSMSFAAAQGRHALYGLRKSMVLKAPAARQQLFCWDAASRVSSRTSAPHGCLPPQQFDIAD